MRHFFVLLLTLAATAGGYSQIKTETELQKPPPFAEALQIVVITPPDWNSTKAPGAMFERASLKSVWKRKGSDFEVVLGRNGSAWAIGSAPGSIKEFKKEGDGRSPAGIFPLRSAFGFAAKPESLTYPYLRIEESTECVDDPDSSHYNKIVDRFKAGNFDWKTSEKMREFVPEYELGIFVGYNSFPVRRSDGSCIFLHIWKDVATPTSGCIAMARSDLEQIVTWIDSKRTPYLVHLPIDAYNAFGEGYRLPKLK
ncbi:L,D-transpeptidase [Leptolyngbya sp. 7M]|uniref:L,D-transpeptidase family protein n=1 Tax=Leptolyngbya sp. 7M TaxID=2812896 RepID=UPI001B8D3C91|nr:L,D-transpeptidase family protein [Leptolyngbya sp. 7M]QYO66165.1 L,D-transpeptidase family protein [Leptolyngbya sp. 7M]